MKEIYKNIPGETEYQVSNLGNVKSLKWGKERILKPYLNGRGYYHVELNKKAKSVHQLVAMAFLGHQPDGTMNIVVNHIDNNQLNNCFNNLELVNQRHNSSCHKKELGCSWNKRDKRWSAQIRINGVKKHLGNFTNKEDAMKAYQEAWNNL
jgi:hypothetical protein